MSATHRFKNHIESHARGTPLETIIQIPKVCSRKSSLRFVAFFVSSSIIMSGCSSVVNTAGSGEYGCPGMPLGVMCKTPAAVYKSTNNDVAPTDFDTPIGTPALSQNAAVSNDGVVAASTAPTYIGQDVKRTISRNVPGPRPVREAAKVVRIWIAPWVDKEDNLHLAQLHYSEVSPRTWTVGRPEINAGSGYVIPHQTFAGIDSSSQTPNISQPQQANPNERPENRSSDGFPSVPSSPTQ